MENVTLSTSNMMTRQNFKVFWNELWKRAVSPHHLLLVLCNSSIRSYVKCLRVLSHSILYPP